MKELHFDLSDDVFEQKFRDGAFDPALFSHEAHLRLAWIHIHKYGEAKAIEHIGVQLPAFVERVGATGKYNLTLTVAAIKAVNHFYNRSAADNFYDFINEFPRLKYNFKELMQYHYSTDIFKSEKAKQQYMEPELLPFT